MPAQRPPDSPTVGGARARARAEVHAAILTTAGSHVADHGAAALSLRAVARDLGMASSAVYRYFPSRDELLTALIVEAYDSLGQRAEAIVEQSRDLAPARRWVDTAMAIRAWAIEQTHAYALLYGTPVPGYAAPQDTTTPGTRVSRALIHIVRDAAADGRLNEAVGSVSPTTSESFVALRSEIDLDVPDSTILALLVAWTQLFGLITFELFGQTRNFVRDDGELFRDAVDTMAIHLGLAS